MLVGIHPLDSKKHWSILAWQRHRILGVLDSWMDMSWLKQFLVTRQGHRSELKYKIEKIYSQNDRTIHYVDDRNKIFDRFVEEERQTRPGVDQEFMRSIPRMSARLEKYFYYFGH
jgi:hypothetical protein